MRRRPNTAAALAASMTALQTARGSRANHLYRVRRLTSASALRASAIMRDNQRAQSYPKPADYSVAAEQDAPSQRDFTPGSMKDRQTRTATVSTCVLLLAFAAVSGALRVVLGYRAAFSQDVVVFVETDAWYHMRLVDSLIHNFPHRIWFDPYLLHPGGQITQV